MQRRFIPPWAWENAFDSSSALLRPETATTLPPPPPPPTTGAGSAVLAVFWGNADGWQHPKPKLISKPHAKKAKRAILRRRSNSLSARDTLCRSVQSDLYSFHCSSAVRPWLSLRLVSAPASIRTSATFSLSAEVNESLGTLETTSVRAVEPFFKSGKSVRRVVEEYFLDRTEIVLGKYWGNTELELRKYWARTEIVLS